MSPSEWRRAGGMAAVLKARDLLREVAGPTGGPLVLGVLLVVEGGLGGQPVDGPGVGHENRGRHVGAAALGVELARLHLAHGVGVSVVGDDLDLSRRLHLFERLVVLHAAGEVPGHPEVGAGLGAGAPHAGVVCGELGTGARSRDPRQDAVGGGAQAGGRRALASQPTLSRFENLATPKVLLDDLPAHPGVRAIAQAVSRSLPG